MKKNITYLLALIALIFTACNDDNDVNPPDDNNPIKGSLVNINPPYCCGNAEPLEVYEDNSGTVWVSYKNTDGTNALYNSTNEFVYDITTETSLCHNRVYSMANDAAGNLWFGTLAGATRFDGTIWEGFNAASDGMSSRVYDMHAGSDQKMWFGTATGLSLYDGTDWSHFDAGNGNPVDDVRQIVEDNSQNLWMIDEVSYGSSAIVKLNINDTSGTGWQVFSNSQIGVSTSVSSITVDDNDNVWISSLQGEIFKYDGTDWQEITGFNGIGDYSQSYIMADSQGMIWFGNDKGLTVWTGQEWVPVTFDEGGDLGGVYKLFEDADNSMWIAAGQLLYLFDRSN